MALTSNTSTSCKNVPTSVSSSNVQTVVSSTKSVDESNNTQMAVGPIDEAFFLLEVQKMLQKAHHIKKQFVAKIWMEEFSANKIWFSGNKEDYIRIDLHFYDGEIKSDFTRLHKWVMV